MATVIFVDTETGGVHEDRHSLLTVGLAAFDTRSREVTRETLVRVRHDTYHVDAPAMEVNGIDLREHHELASVPEVAANEVRAFLRFRSRRRVMLGGHNVNFDVRFLMTLLPDYHELMIGSVVDTKVVAHFLIHAGLLPKTLSTRLEDLAAHFDVPIRPHDALEDARATARVYGAMLALLSGGSPSL